MQGYHDKYLREYKKRMNPKELWKKHMSPEEKKKLNTYFYWIMICIAIVILVGMFMMGINTFSFMAFAQNKKVVVIISVIIELVMAIILYILHDAEEDFIKKVKGRVASDEYKMDSLDDKINLEIESFKDYLTKTNVKTEKQIQVVLNSISEAEKENAKKNKITTAGIGVFILPIWNKQVELIYKQIVMMGEKEGGNNIAIIEDGMANFISLCVLVIGVAIIVYALHKGLESVKATIRYPKYEGLKEMKAILLEMHLESMKE